MRMYLTPLPNRKLADLRAAERNYRERSDKANNDARPEIKKNRAIYDQLHLVGNPQGKSLPKEVIKEASERYDKFLLLMLKANGVKPGDTDGGPFIDSEDMDQQKFDISILFDRWCCNVGGKDKSCLFRELNETTVQQILSKGQWNFKAIAEAKADKGVDEGGLTRMFLEKCWTHMGELSIIVEGVKIRLFDEEACGVNPLPDDIVVDRIRSAFEISGDELDGHDGALAALRKAQVLYRAVGRIICHSLATNHILPCNLLPGILRSCKLRIQMSHAFGFSMCFSHTYLS
jgi:hypothetical protein